MVVIRDNILFTTEYLESEDGRRKSEVQENNFGLRTSDFGLRTSNNLDPVTNYHHEY
jgi:hypothetical protein